MDTAQLAAVASDHRVHRTFAFLDLCGFTDFVDEHGDDGGGAGAPRAARTVREVAPLFGVRVEKWLGDGLMLVGVDSEPLVGAALAIEQRHSRIGQLELRGGIACGDVILLEGDDYVGRAVNLASRLCDIARRASCSPPRRTSSCPTGSRPRPRTRCRSRAWRRRSRWSRSARRRCSATSRTVAPRTPSCAVVEGLTRPIRPRHAG